MKNVKATEPGWLPLRQSNPASVHCFCQLLDIELGFARTNMLGLEVVLKRGGLSFRIGKLNFVYECPCSAAQNFGVFLPQPSLGKEADSLQEGKP